MAAPRATVQDVLSAAERRIERRESIAFDVAVEHNQIFDNVAHMSWFRSAVAQELIDTMNKYAHLDISDVS